MEAVIHPPEQGFDEWRDEQDFDYQRTESAVIDYVNEHIDYGLLDSAIAESAEVGEVDTACDELGFHADSSEADVVKEHLKTYIDAQEQH